ncbi:MAG: diaminopimelate decarboxylase [Desulfobacterales bacterium]|jgi:diaminopimelate decarboxylase
MPISPEFENRLLPILDEIVNYYGTPFHIYDETGIRQTGNDFIAAFSRLNGFREYFAVKALPNPHILQIMQDLGFGFDCSSIAELILSRQIGARGEDIMFSSNNTTAEEFKAAGADGGSILNLDDISLIPKVPQMPETISFRYNPGPGRSGNRIIGDPEESKYGVADSQIIGAYKAAMDRGAHKFGLHTMLVSNELNARYMVQTAAMLLEVATRVSKALDIRIQFINIGGGLGIPYKPGQEPLDIFAMAAEIVDLFAAYKAQNGYEPRFYIESGRYMTGPHGVLVTTAINQKDIYRKYIGVDASMAALMRPAIYGAYHHVTVARKQPGERKGSDLPKLELHEVSCRDKNYGKPRRSSQERRREQRFQKVDVVGSLCENNDKFAIQRLLPEIQDGDRVLIHDTGAHGHAMGFNYNGRLRPKELLLRSNGSVDLIRREETVADYFATLNFAPQALAPNLSDNRNAA